MSTGSSSDRLDTGTTSKYAPVARWRSGRGISETIFAL
ncbi:predicted protein [Botrytis cinerea T4]|uniref:Uncharacterized protein n=1 Tax=Botryotinia fuckeliana (strain T4) TaxID=999810 RepID=G2Y9P4_BOTF4|nr:predicted protein [Botrytis cinerea T4]